MGLRDDEDSDNEVANHTWVTEIIEEVSGGE